MVLPLTSYIFQRIAKQAMLAGITHDHSREAIKWFRKKAFETTRVSPEKMMETAGPFKRIPKDSFSPNSIGKMYCFFYDPKWKDELPYYDKFPLIFPIEFYKDGFLGINLHYLPYYARAQLMDALYTAANNKKWDSTTRLKISYSILKKAAKYKYFKPCIKRYLTSHIRSPILHVSPKEWDMAIMLPTERFMKARKERVWRDSILSVD